MSKESQDLLAILSVAIIASCLTLVFVNGGQKYDSSQDTSRSQPFKDAGVHAKEIGYDHIRFLNTNDFTVYVRGITSRDDPVTTLFVEKLKPGQVIEAEHLSGLYIYRKGKIIGYILCDGNRDAYLDDVEKSIEISD